MEIGAEAWQIVRDRGIPAEEKMQAGEKGEAVAPFSWESLPSLLARAAGKRGYRWSEKMYRAANSGHQFFPRLFPAEIPFLHRRDDYQFLAPLLGLDEASLYALTLHHLTPLLQSPASQALVAPRPSSEKLIAAPLLQEETAERYCLPGAVTKVCPACLEEEERYERLYWNVRLVLLCPRHQLLLIERCPRCAQLIPALRQTTPTECPYCLGGDYRAAARLHIAPDTLLSQGQHVLLQMLGVDESNSEQTPTSVLAEPLAALEPWQYFDLLDSFGSVAPFLRPEKALTTTCRELGLPIPPLASVSQREQRRMMHVSLFHALFLSWPSQVDALLGLSSLRGESLIDWNQGNQRRQGAGTDLYTQLLGLFEVRKKEGQRQISLQQRWANPIHAANQNTSLILW